MNLFGNALTKPARMSDANLSGMIPKHKRSLMFYILGAVITTIAWYLLTLDPPSLRAFGPIGTLRALPSLFNNPRFWAGLLQTMERLVGGLGLAAVIGIPVGLAVGYLTWCAQATYLPFQILRMVSPLSWAPVAIILFGVGSGPVYFLITIAAIWPMILNTAAGVRAAEPRWLDAARCLGARDYQVLRYVLIRASLPHILVGLQLALGVAWIVVVPAEMLGVASGLGYMILDFRDVNDYSSIMALILVIGGLGLLLDWPVRAAVRWAHWH